MELQEKEKIKEVKSTEDINEVKNKQEIESIKEIDNNENNSILENNQEIEGIETINENKVIENLEENEIIKVENTDTYVEQNDDTKKSKKNVKVSPFIFAFIILVILTCLFYIFYKIYNFYKPTFQEAVAITSIEISLPEQEIETGIPIEIQTKIEPTHYTLANLQWVSSNPEIITVENGIITALSEGESSIYVINDNGIKSNTILVRSVVKIKEITLSKEFLEIYVDGAETLLATISPENATNKSLIWKSSDENIATVDENGTVNGINVGECIISVSSSDETVLAQCTVKVNAIEVNSLSLDETNVTLAVGQEYLLIGSISPSNATYRNLTWTSSNNDVLTVKNGKIKAISEGDAVVTITSKSGKTANCYFTVKSSVSSGTKRYAKDTYTVRSGPNNNYSKLASVYKNEEIEVLKVSGNWTKVRTSSGTVGYMLSSGYSSSKTYYISNVPYLNQFTLGYPTGCEAVSATMAARYSGYNISAYQVIAATPTDEKGKREETKIVEVTVEHINEETGETELITQTQEQTDWYGGNPFEVFVGHPSKGLAAGSYGCFAKPITIALEACGVPATNISGCSIDTVFNYVANGKPVIVWCKKNAGDLTEGVTWKYEDGSGSFKELVGEHCAVLIGYDGEYVYLNDPSAGKNVKQPRSKFVSNWYKLFNQAVIIN